jgi:predicted GIY-YIG superfamily endonuclease
MEVIMSKKRDTYTYDFKVGSKIVHSGITNDLSRREAEHKQRWSNGRIHQVGNVKTRDGALNWEKTKHKTITPKRK